MTDWPCGRLHDYCLVRVRSRLHHVHLLLRDTLDDAQGLAVWPLDVLRMDLHRLMWEGSLRQGRRREGARLYLDGNLSSTHL